MKVKIYELVGDTPEHWDYALVVPIIDTDGSIIGLASYCAERNPSYWLLGDMHVSTDDVIGWLKEINPHDYTEGEFEELLHYKIDWNEN